MSERALQHFALRRASECVDLLPLYFAFTNQISENFSFLPRHEDMTDYGGGGVCNKSCTNVRMLVT